MKIEVTAVRLITPKETGLRGFADVKLDDILVRDFRIFHRHGSHYVQSPHSSFKRDRQIVFTAIVELPEELRMHVNAQIISAFLREKEKKDGNESQPTK